MAQIETNFHSDTHSLKRRAFLRVDLTPMVDLGFLLITFFMLSTTLAQPNVANLVMPKDAKIETKVHESAVLTLMPVSNNEIDYFEGTYLGSESVKHCSFNELRAIIQQKQKKVAGILGSKKETVIIVQPEDESSYKDFIDIMDEIQINDIHHYFIIDHPAPTKPSTLNSQLLNPLSLHHAQ